ncbi:MAG TPA: VOC family protein [Vicinamibacterales bacterium]|nr:VOC family protein [Vicinamibacterales bacterium]
MVTPPRIARVLETALDCGDLQACVSFYQRLLELPVMLETDRVVALDAGGGSVLLLFPRGGATEPFHSPGGVVPGHDSNGPGHLAFAIDASDVDRWETRLADLGIPIESRVRWERGGLSLYFRDPDGRSVELATPGIWANY